MVDCIQDRVDDRHVEFCADVTDDSTAEQRESTRLQRRDTPHHLKNKRVNTSTPPLPGTTTPQSDEAGQAVAAADAENRVRRILARQIGKICESVDGVSTEQNDAAAEVS